jgi:hypothetical protein
MLIELRAQMNARAHSSNSHKRRPHSR